MGDTKPSPTLQVYVYGCRKMYEWVRIHLHVYGCRYMYEWVRILLHVYGCWYMYAWAHKCMRVACAGLGVGLYACGLCVRAPVVTIPHTGSPTCVS